MSGQQVMIDFVVNVQSTGVLCGLGKGVTVGYLLCGQRSVSRGLVWLR